MGNKQILIAREKCLDCHHFIKSGLFKRDFVCRFGLIPVPIQGEKENTMKIVCNQYIDYPKKDAPAAKLVLKFSSKRPKLEGK